MKQESNTWNGAGYSPETRIQMNTGELRRLRTPLGSSRVPKGCQSSLGATRPSSGPQGLGSGPVSAYGDEGSPWFWGGEAFNPRAGQRIQLETPPHLGTIHGWMDSFFLKLPPSLVKGA